MGDGEGNSPVTGDELAHLLRTDPEGYAKFIEALRVVAEVKEEDESEVTISRSKEV